MDFGYLPQKPSQVLFYLFSLNSYVLLSYNGLIDLNFIAIAMESNPNIHAAHHNGIAFTIPR